MAKPFRPSNSAAGAGTVVARQQIVQTYSGPLPPPEAFERYNQTLPSAAERIMAQAEVQSAHRRQVEMHAVRVTARDSLLGLLSAFLIGTTGMVCATIVILHGQPVSGTILGSAALVSIVGAFIYGTRARRAPPPTT